MIAGHNFQTQHNPEAMQNIQQHIARQMGGNQNQTPPKSLTPEEEREENRRKLREKIREKSMARQPKDVKMKEQFKALEKSTSQTIDTSNLKEVLNQVVSDPQQKKMLQREMEKYMEKGKDKKE
jgi:hypothetical protein